MGSGRTGNWAVRWTATVPVHRAPSPTRSPDPLTSDRYTGPPGYAAPPRWGFPRLTWRRPTTVPGTGSDVGRSGERLRLIGRNALAVLWMLAGLATIAAIGEIWRYSLLVISRERGLDPKLVGASDALVLAFSLLTFAVTLFAFAVTLWWLFVARAAAAEETGQHPPRPVWQVLVGTLVPVVNTVLAGSILAELEHAVQGRPAQHRPRPTRLTLVWWALWVGNAVLVVLTVVWRMRGGAQADADAVLLSGLTDLAAACLAGVTAVVVGRMTRLLAPVDTEFSRGEHVVRVRGVPEPSRRPRPETAAR